jgi:hypothetical protein
VRGAKRVSIRALACTSCSPIARRRASVNDGDGDTLRSQTCFLAVTRAASTTREVIAADRRTVCCAQRAATDTPPSTRVEALSQRTRTTRPAARGGRLHRQDDPRAGPRDADVTGRATASVRHRTAASRGETIDRIAPTQGVPWHNRFHDSGVVVPAMPMPRSR